jgi:uncharacterized protein (DUF736 family)
MASTYDNTNRGVLFRETEKQSDKHPDYTGKLNVGGKDFYIAGWLKESKKKTKFLSLQVKPAEQQVSREPEEDSDIPF